jgi:putative FmdB family regulatory protein
MPTYEYRCDACGHEFEIYQQITAPVMRKCPECSKLKLQRLIGTGAGVIFKGSGFYETDYRSDSYKKSAEADKKAAQPPAEKPDSKDAAKPASDGASTASESTPKKTPEKKPSKSAPKRKR